MKGSSEIKEHKIKLNTFSKETHTFPKHNHVDRDEFRETDTSYDQ